MTMIRDEAVTLKYEFLRLSGNPKYPPCCQECWKRAYQLMARLIAIGDEAAFGIDIPEEDVVS